jgi:hypothetical protein
MRSSIESDESHFAPEIILVLSFPEIPGCHCVMLFCDPIAAWETSGTCHEHACRLHSSLAHNYF